MEGPRRLYRQSAYYRAGGGRKPSPRNTADRPNEPMYDAIEDPYCYPGTTVLKNRAGHRTQRALTQFETAMSAQRADEPLPIGRLSVHHYRAIHRHLFQDVYPWAGTFRTVRISRDDSMFCYPEHIRSQMRMLFGRLRQERYFRDLTPDEFVRKATTFLVTLNAIHPTTTIRRGPAKHYPICPWWNRYRA